MKFQNVKKIYGMPITTNQIVHIVEIYVNYVIERMLQLWSHKINCIKTNFDDTWDYSYDQIFPQGSQNVLTEIISNSISLLMDFLNAGEYNNEFVLKELYRMQRLFSRLYRIPLCFREDWS